MAGLLAVVLGGLISTVAVDSCCGCDGVDFAPYCLDGDAACSRGIGVGNQTCHGCIPLGSAGGIFSLVSIDVVVVATSPAVVLVVPFVVISAPVIISPALIVSLIVPSAVALVVAVWAIIALMLVVLVVALTVSHLGM